MLTRIISVSADSYENKSFNNVNKKIKYVSLIFDEISW